MAMVMVTMTVTSYSDSDEITIVLYYSWLCQNKLVIKLRV